MSWIAFLHTTLHTPLWLVTTRGRQLIGVEYVEKVEPIGIAVERSETLSTRSVRTTDDLLVANHGACVTKTDNQAEFPRQIATI